MISTKKLLYKICEALSVAYVVEQGTDGIWTYRKWSDGTAECWGRVAVPSHTYAVNDSYNVTGTPPSGLFVNPSNPILSASGAINGVVHSSIGFTLASNLSVQTYLINRSAGAVTNIGWVCWHLIGKWK